MTMTMTMTLTITYTEPETGHPPRSPGVCGRGNTDSTMMIGHSAAPFPGKDAPGGARS